MTFEEEVLETFPISEETFEKLVNLKNKHCLDKQLIREVIDKFFPGGDVITFEFAQGKGNLKEELLKELKLDD